MFTLGDDAGTLPAAVAAWQRAVRARGGVATRMPGTVDPLNVGKLAARYGGAGSSTPTAKPRYELADAAALLADGRGAAVLSSQIAAGKRVEQLEKDVGASVALVRRGAQAVLELPRDVVGGVLGIPPWLVPALLIGGVGYVGYHVLKSGGAGAIASRIAR